MEKSVDHLEEKKRHLTSLAEAVNNTKAAEKAAVSVGLPPIVISKDSMALDSDYECHDLGDHPPPSYESIIQHKTLGPAVDMIAMMVNGDAPSGGAGRSEKNDQPRPSTSDGRMESPNPTILQKISTLLNSDKGLNGTFGALNADDTGVEVVEEADFEFQILSSTGTRRWRQRGP